MLLWSFLIEGPPETPYAGGWYWGRIKFPNEYPFKPPALLMVTPSGRFQPGHAALPVDVRLPPGDVEPGLDGRDDPHGPALLHDGRPDDDGRHRVERRGEAAARDGLGRLEPGAGGIRRAVPRLRRARARRREQQQPTAPGAAGSERRARATPPAPPAPPAPRSDERAAAAETGGGGTAAGRDATATSDEARVAADGDRGDGGEGRPRSSRSELASSSPGRRARSTTGNRRSWSAS